MRRTLLLALVLLCSFGQQGRAESSDERVRVSDGLFLVVRSASPQELVGIAQENFPGASQAWLDWLFALLFGESGLPLAGFAADENFGLVVLREETGNIPFFLSRMLSDNADHRFFEGIDFSTVTYDGWTIATPAAEDLDRPDADWRELIEMVRRPRAHPVELETGGAALAQAFRQGRYFGTIEHFAREFADVDSSLLGLIGLFDAIEEETESILSIKVGLGAERAAVVLYLGVEAAEGSPLAEFWGADHVPTMTPVEWLPREGLVHFLAGTDFSALDEYIEKVIGRGAGEKGEAMAALLEPFRNLLRLYAGNGRASTAGTMDFRGFEPLTVQVTQVALTDEQFEDLLRATRDWMGGSAEDDANPKVGAVIVDGHRVYAFGTGGFGDSDLDETATEDVMYLAKIGEYLLSGDDRQAVLGLVGLLASGVKPDQSAALFFREEQPAALQWAIDSEALLDRIISFTQIGEVEKQEERLHTRGRIATGAGSLHGRIEVPVELILALWRQLDVARNLVVEEDLEFEAPDR